MSSSLSRTPVIDMAKGLACIAIVWHHLAFYGPMSDIAQPLAPGLIAWLYDYGRMAVQVFLVLGGYLAAASLAPQGVPRFDHAGHAIAKRFVRLVVPYAVALLLTVLVAALVRPWMEHASVPDEPTLAQLLANALLLQDIVGESALSAGVWYVAGMGRGACAAWRVGPAACGAAGAGRDRGGRGPVAVGVQPHARAGHVGRVFLRRIRAGHAGVLGRAGAPGVGLARRDGAARGRCAGP
jgi:hypothetical protein